MKYALIVIITALSFFYGAKAQNPYTIWADTLEIKSFSGAAEFKLENATKSITGGVLANAGDGLTEFRLSSGGLLPEGCEQFLDTTLVTRTTASDTMINGLDSVYVYDLFHPSGLVQYIATLNDLAIWVYFNQYVFPINDTLDQLYVNYDIVEWDTLILVTRTVSCGDSTVAFTASDNSNIRWQDTIPAIEYFDKTTGSWEEYSSLWEEDSLSQHIIPQDGKGIRVLLEDESAYSWELVVDSINLNGIIPYVGFLAEKTDTFNSIMGILPLDESDGLVPFMSNINPLDFSGTLLSLKQSAVQYAANDSLNVSYATLTPNSFTTDADSLLFGSDSLFIVKGSVESTFPFIGTIASEGIGTVEINDTISFIMGVFGVPTFAVPRSPKISGLNNVTGWTATQQIYNDEFNNLSANMLSNNLLTNESIEMFVNQFGLNMRINDDYVFYVDSVGADGYKMSYIQGNDTSQAEIVKKQFGNPAGTFQVIASGVRAEKDSSNYMFTGNVVNVTPFGNFYAGGTTTLFQDSLLSYIQGQDGGGIFQVQTNIGLRNLSNPNQSVGMLFYPNTIQATYGDVGGVRLYGDLLTGFNDIRFPDKNGTFALYGDWFGQEKYIDSLALGTSTLNPLSLDTTVFIVDYQGVSGYDTLVLDGDGNYEGVPITIHNFGTQNSFILKYKSDAVWNNLNLRPRETVVMTRAIFGDWNIVSHYKPEYIQYVSNTVDSTFYLSLGQNYIILDNDAGTSPRTVYLPYDNPAVRTATILDKNEDNDGGNQQPILVKVENNGILNGVGIDTVYVMDQLFQSATFKWVNAGEWLLESSSGTEYVRTDSVGAGNYTVDWLDKFVIKSSDATQDTIFLFDMGSGIGEREFSNRRNTIEFVETSINSVIISASGDDVIINPNGTTDPFSLARSQGIVKAVWRNHKWYFKD